MARSRKSKAQPTNDAHTPEPARRKSNRPPAGHVDPYALHIPDTDDPKQLHNFVQHAGMVEERAREAKKIALRKLREALPAATFSVDGKLYQIRERSGEPYVVALATPDDVIEL